MHLAVQKHASSCSKACIHETSERSHYVNRGSWPAEGSTLIYLQSPKGTHNEQNDISLTWCMVMCDPFGVDALRDMHTPRVKTRGYLCVTSSRSFYIENRSTKNKTRFILYCSHLFVPLHSISDNWTFERCEAAFERWTYERCTAAIELYHYCLWVTYALRS